MKSGLLIEAKRSRAGRDIFLPGGWEALKTPNLPIESWKLPMYDVDPNNLGSIRNRRIVVSMIMSDLFAKAWERYESGDVPQFEEV